MELDTNSTAAQAKAMVLQLVYSTPDLSSDQRRAISAALGAGKSVLGYSRDKVSEELQKLARKRGAG